MPVARILVAAMATVLAGGLAGCGSSSSATSNAVASTASKADFCRTFENLGPALAVPVFRQSE